MFGKFARLAAPCLVGLLVSAGFAQQPDVKQIISNSVASNQKDFKAAPGFNWKERDRTPHGSKTYQVTMIEGTPYYRMIAENDKALSPEQQRQELQKQQQEAAKRKSESPDARRQRVAKYEQERTRDNNMMNQLTQAFNFKLIGTKKARGFDVWVLKATPRPGYQPPNMDARVLLGMEGEMWIDQKTYQWVHVHATVIHPVSIAGFLAQVEPGTEFDLVKMPVGNGIWQASHFSMKAQAKVLHVFSHNSQQDETYFGYEPVS